MDEAPVFFGLSTLIFLIGLFFLLPILGFGTGVQYSRIYSNLTTTVVTRGGREYTITIPKSATSSLRYAEKLDITYCNAEKIDSKTWRIVIEIHNTGKVDATIDGIYVNNRDFTSSTTPRPPYTVQAGKTAILTLIVSRDDGFNPGQNLQIIIHTSSGGQYPTQVVLP